MRWITIEARMPAYDCGGAHACPRGACVQPKSRRMKIMFKNKYLICILWTFPGVVAAQTDNFPSKALRIVVPFAPGGSVDLISRMISPKMSELLGQQIIIDNRAGASGNIGTEMVARAAPDGHTLLM